MNTYQQILKHFGGPSGLAAALGIERQAIYQWKGKIPPLRAYQIEQITNGQFKAVDMNAKAVTRKSAGEAA